MGIPKLLRTSAPLVRKKSVTRSVSKLSSLSTAGGRITGPLQHWKGVDFLHNSNCPSAWHDRIQQRLCGHSLLPKPAINPIGRESLRLNRADHHEQLVGIYSKSLQGIFDKSEQIVHPALPSRSRRLYLFISSLFSAPTCGNARPWPGTGSPSIQARVFSTASLRRSNASIAPRLKHTSALWDRTTPSSQPRTTMALLTSSTPITSSTAITASTFSTLSIAPTSLSSSKVSTSSSLRTRLARRSPSRGRIRKQVGSKANILKHVRASHLGAKRRRRLGMLRAQQQRKAFQRNELPRHVSQLHPPDSTHHAGTPRPIFREGRRRRKRANQLATIPGLDGYTHIHYYWRKGGSARRRILGMQQYLLQSKAASKRGTEVRRAIQERQLRAVNQKRKNLQRSMRRNFVYRHSLLLDQLRGSLRHGAYSQATRIAKSLIKASSQGAKLPLPRYWLRLAKIDQFRYRAERCEYALSLQGAPFSTPSTRRFFTTFEFNMMLERCKELEDWSHGYLISKLLLKRYLSPKFTFGRSVLDHGSPDSRTIHSMAEMFVKSQHPDRAELLFSTLVGRYPNPIPIGVYESYVQLLATDSRHIPQIELALRRLEKHGPTPTPTLYNAVLKAMGRQNGPDRIRRLVSQMIAGGFRPDQQTYRILIAQCLNHRNMQGAYDWLAEYERQGFEVRTSTLEPFLKTCSRWTVYYSGLQKQLPGPRSTKQRNPAKPTYDESAQEWLHQALLVFQIVSDRNLIPSMQMYNKLIEALLAQSRVSEAQKVLRVLMDTHLYIPTHATWALFFNHHLQASDHVAAMKVLTAMRKHPEPLTESSLAIQVPKPFRPIRPKPAVPTAMYSTLFQHLLDHGKASLAEQTLYDMMVHQKRTVRPTEKQVVDLIWKLTWDAEAAERVYEILFSQIQRSDKRGNSGPIHLAKVGVMSAKAHTTVPSQHEDVWRSWMAMTHHYQLHQQGRSKMALEKDQAVMSLAFEQVALAMRNLPTRKQGSFSYVKAQQQLQLQGKVRVSSVDGWDAGTFGAGGKGMQREGDVVTDRVDHMAVKGKLLHLIERLLRRPDYLHAEHSNLRDTVVLGTEGSSLRAQESESRLDYLKQSMAWVRQYGIPLRVEGMDVYLNGLISHRDLRSVQIMLAEITDFEPPLSSVPSSSSLTLATLLTRYREYT